MATPRRNELQPMLLGRLGGGFSETWTADAAKSFRGGPEGNPTRLTSFLRYQSPVYDQSHVPSRA